MHGRAANLRMQIRDQPAVLYKWEKYQETAEDLTMIIMIDPKNVLAYRERGSFYERLASQETDRVLQNEYRRKSNADYEMYQKLQAE
jgi:hypothetical protein